MNILARLVITTCNRRGGDAVGRYKVTVNKPAVSLEICVFEANLATGKGDCRTLEVRADGVVLPGSAKFQPMPR